MWFNMIVLSNPNLDKFYHENSLVEDLEAEEGSLTKPEHGNLGTWTLLPGVCPYQSKYLENFALALIWSPKNLKFQVKKSVEKEKPITDEALTPTTKEVKKVDEPPAPSPATTNDEERPQAEKSILAIPAESEEKTADKKIEPPTIEEVKKQDETPALDATSKDIPKLAKEPTPEPEAQSIPDQVVDITKSEPEVQSEAGKVETLDKESKIEPAEEKSEQQVTIVDIVETFEAVEKKNEQIHLKASEQKKAKEAEVSKAEPKEEASEPVPVVEEKLTKASEKNEQEYDNKHSVVTA
ncbi:hypothetical protein BC332_24158 [Capsicum chinense]|nr:hypothetical protein BC332_24158 [Capsicum chinense]